MQTPVRLNQDQWEAIYEAYLASGLTVADFYRAEFRRYCPEKRAPNPATVYSRFDEIAQARRNNPEQGRVRIVSIDGADLPAPSTKRPIPVAARAAKPGTVRLFLPRGARVEIDTDSPEAFMLALVSQFGAPR